MLNKIILSPIQRFRNLLKVDRKDITQVYIYALFNGLVTLSLPLGIQAIINLLQGGEPSTAWLVLVSVVIIGVAFTGVFQLLQLRIVENISQNIFSRASFEFAYRIPRIKHSSFENYYAPELANRFFDTLTIQKGLPKILIDFSLALFQIIVGLVVLSFYHPFFIFYSIILVGLIYIVLSIIAPSGLKTSLKESKFKYKIAFWIEEIARTKVSFKLINNSNFELEKSNHHVEEYLEAREGHFKVLVRQFLYLIGFKVLIATGLLTIGSFLVFNQQMNIGQFVAAEIIIILIIASVEKLITSLDSIYDVLTALEKIGYVTDMPLDRKDGLALSNAHKSFSVAVDHLTFKHSNAAINTIDDLSFRIEQGKRALIMGPSGSGKSTLLQLISGILEPSGGLINVNDIPLKSIDSDELKKHVGYSLSNNLIFQGTIMENVVMGRDIDTEDLVNALNVTQLNDYLSSIQYGLKTVLDPEGKKIPRSIENKILLARAIVNNPKLLILEDPLDHVLPDEKIEIIKKVMSNKEWTVIVSAVDPVWSKHVDIEIQIEKGRLNSIK